MNTPQTESLRIADCEMRQERDNAHLEMNRRARGVRYARMRCRVVWDDTLCTTREAQLSYLSGILNP